MLFRRAPLALVLVAAAGSHPVFAQSPPDTSRTPAATGPSLARAALASPLPNDPAVRSGTLPNGVRYFVRANTRPERRAELRLVVDAGSVLEEERERGLAHFVEHMAFNGTKRFEKQELVSYLERVGMRFGPDLNAYTGFDETVYQLTVPTDSAGVLERGLDILHEWAHAVSFDSLEVERERPVVIEEWRSGQGAGSRLRDIQLPVVFHGSRYAVRLPIGDTAVLKAATAADLRAFYERWYRPDLMAVVAVGDFDAERVEREIRTRFGALRAPRTAQPRPATPMPPHAEPLVSVATDPEATSTSVSVLYKHPGAPVRTLQDFRAVLIEMLHTDLLNRRLFEIAQRPDAPFLGAGSGRGRYLRDLDAYSLAAGVREGGVLDGLRALLQEAARVERHGFTATELERARRDLLRSMEHRYAERDKTMSVAFADEYVDAFLYREPFVSTADAWLLYQRFVPGVTLEEVNAVGRTFIGDGSQVVLVSAPASATPNALPTEAELLAAFAAAESMDVAAYDDEVSDAPLVPQPPAPGAVAEAIRHDAAGVVEWKLSNGVRVLVKPTAFKDDQVLLSARSAGGHSLAADSLFVSASLASTVAAVGGVGAFDQVQLDKQLAGTAVSVTPSIDMLEERVSASASPRDLETMLQLVHLYFTAPREDSAAYGAFLARARSVLENRGRSPQSAFGDTLQVTLASHHPRARPASPDMLGELDLGTAVRFYRERFANAADFTFAIVGTVDTAALRPLVERWIGSLPATAERERARDVGIRRPDGVVRRVVYRGLEPRAETQLVFHGDAEYGMPQRFELAALADVLEIRLRETLREELGGTYGANVSASLAREPRVEYTVGVSFGSAPDRVDELVSAVFAEIDKLRTSGPTADDLAKVQEMMRRSMETGLEQNGVWLSQLLAYDRLGLPLHEIALERRWIDALTPERIRDAALRYLDRGRHVQVSLLPESMAPQPAPATP